jgi:hypothetical protein
VQQTQILAEHAQLRPQRGELAGEPREQRRIDGGSHDSHADFRDVRGHE